MERINEFSFDLLHNQLSYTLMTHKGLTPWLPSTPRMQCGVYVDLTDSIRGWIQIMSVEGYIAIVGL